MTRNLCRSCLLLSAAFAAPGVLAEEAAPGWERGFTFVPYGWIAGLDGEIGTQSDAIDPGGDRVDVSVDDALEQIGFMFFGEWRGERWLIFFDSVWANVTQDGELNLTNLLPATEVSAGIDGNIYQLSLGYRLFDLDRSTISLYGGARYYDIVAEARFDGTLLPQPLTTTSAQSWTDAVIGARWGIRLNENWHALVLADAGFGESDMTWQMFATLGYRFNDWGSVVFGYRYMSLDYDTPEYLVDLALSGPAIGVALRFD